jgi:hypothetical protein
VIGTSTRKALTSSTDLRERLVKRGGLENDELTLGESPEFWEYNGRRLFLLNPKKDGSHLILILAGLERPFTRRLIHAVSKVFGSEPFCTYWKSSPTPEEDVANIYAAFEWDESERRASDRYFSLSKNIGEDPHLLDIMGSLREGTSRRKVYDI